MNQRAAKPGFPRGHWNLSLSKSLSLSICSPCAAYEKDLASPPLSTSVILASALRAEDEDFTKREVTDPKLVITSQSTLLPEKDDKWMDACAR